MAVRSDFSVNFELSPRVIDVTSASEEILVQDSHDSLSTLQDSSEGAQFEFLVSSAGGEDLGGGVSVGLTTVLNDAQYAFQATSPLEVGTVTTPSATSLIDATATFQTNLVKRGDWIINFTDQSVTEILTVVSETEVTTRGLRNGSLNTFTSADAYKVWEVKEASMSGGNFTAVDSVSADIKPFFPVFGRTFALTASSSATATSQTALEVQLSDVQTKVTEIHGQVARSIYIDTELVPVGDGNQQTPFNNISDGVDLAELENVFKLELLSDTTLDRQLSNFTVDGIGLPVIDFNGQTMNNTIFERCNLTGTMLGSVLAITCRLNNFSGLNGLCRDIAVSGTLTPGTNSGIHLTAVTQAIPGSPVILDMNSGGFSKIIVHNFSGDINIINMTDAADLIELHVNNGVVDIAASCTAGTIVLHGDCNVTDNSAGTTVDVTDASTVEVTKASLVSIKGKTDQMVFTNANELDSNVKSVNDVEVIGDGSVGNEWGPTP